ncbi:sugar ABC transporter ATP-binding protein [Erysipelothrix sp. HDW6C]|uniref:sugar ABC transporter ATP-binding protein n=1 Tax=Erysipelothrix sp. HDW6C TaxID=2714930 RepID=UPI00140C96AD|nr:sugar ABC transporter ATP-binding protein [Erysipelothrix sp. HDW6C]QIK68986.1 sugar ABC transporter ATP-binding protein [Erysipelothrix sp. HDW6C]
MIEMKNISKSFGANRVLSNVDLTIKDGEILALLGENGAGKSTLMNILGGVLPMDEGEIMINNHAVNFESPVDSLSSGIAFIHQELNLVNDLAVYENLFLGNEIMKNRFVPDTKTMIEKTREIFAKMDLELDPCVHVATLDASYKQIVEISRALLMDAKYIIMDEPTTSLTGPEIERVFSMMKKLRNEGVGIIFISHKLEEIMEICDCYTVLRNGNMVASDRVANTNTKELARHMVGHDVRSEVIVRERNSGEVVLELNQLTHETLYKNVDLQVRTGEVMGVTGLLGDGRSELFLSVFGDIPYQSGTIKVSGKPVTINSITAAMELGIGYVPRNRKENAIIRDMDILENGTLASFDAYSNAFGQLDMKGILEAFNQKREELHIKMGKPTDSINSLSGGNQQKVVLSKWLLTNPKILILDNPTQGVDVGSKEEIYDIIHKLADSGVAIILLSNEPQEIIRTCDRTLVMYHGVIQGELDHEQMNEHSIMHLATGGKDEEGSDINGSN